MKRAITKKHTLFRPKLQLALVIWTKMWPTRTPKDLEKSIIRSFIQQESKWCFHLTESCRKSINKKACSGKHITPKTGKEWRHGQAKQDQSQLYDDAYAQLHHFADVYEDKTHDV